MFIGVLPIDAAFFSIRSRAASCSFGIFPSRMAFFTVSFSVLIHGPGVSENLHNLVTVNRRLEVADSVFLFQVDKFLPYKLEVIEEMLLSCSMPQCMAMTG